MREDVQKADTETQKSLSSLKVLYATSDGTANGWLISWVWTRRWIHNLCPMGLITDIIIMKALRTMIMPARIVIDLL